MDGRVQYLNTDLDLEAAQDLSELSGFLAKQGLYCLHVGLGADERWYARLNVEASHRQPNVAITRMLRAIRKLPPPLRAVWDACEVRAADIGYDSGYGPRYVAQELPAKILADMAQVNLVLRVTVYAMADSDEPLRR